MSANSGTLPSSNKTTKSGYDHLDINKLYKGKSAEPAPKTVTQKHGMQTLGKAPPARRAGGVATVKTDTNESPPSSLPTPTPPPQQQPPQQQQPPPGWVGPMPHPPKGPPPPPQHNHNVPGAPVPGPGHDIKWSGGMQRGNGFPSQRFAQDFPSLEATGEPVKNQNQNYSGPSPGTMQSMSKAPDNQYGPGPILRPQTEGSWTQGGGLGMQRPPGPMQSQNAPSRDFATDRSNLGGPTPPPMSLGQAGPIPPPLGAYPMPFRGMHPPPPYMYQQGSGPPSGPGNFYPPGPGAIRYGMPIPPGAPPPGSYPPGGHPGDGRREDSGRGGRGPPQNQGRPGSHFTSTSIIKKGEMERMDEIGTQEGGWASTNDAIDYNKKINFSDDDEGNRDSKRSHNNRNEMREKDISEEEYDRTQGKPDKTSINERDREPHSRYDPGRQSRDQYEHENEDDRNKRRPFDNKDRGDRGDRGGRRSRDEDWRSNSNRYDDDRGKKGPPGGPRTDARGPPQDFQSSKYPTNIPPRFQRQNMPSTFNQIPNQRQTPSPVSTSTSGSGKDRDRDYRDREWERDRDQQNYRDREPTYKILERRKTDSESSRDSKDAKKGQSGNDQEPRLDRFQDKERGKGRLISSDNRGKGADDTNKPSHLTNNVEKEVNDLGKSESRTVIKDIIRKDDAKTAFRTRTDLSTSSWADEVEDEESSKMNEDLDTRKGRDSHQASLHKADDRQRVEPGPKRVYLTQRKVENLVTHSKPDQHAEQKFQPQPKKEEKADEKNKSAWGERAKEKQAAEKELHVKEQATPSPDKEIVKSSSRDNLDKDKHRKDVDRPRERDFDRHNRERDNRERDFDRRRDSDKHTDSQKPRDVEKPKEQDKQNKEFIKHKDNREFDKRERERLDRNEYESGRGGGGNPRYNRKERERKQTPNWNDREKVKSEKEDSPVPRPIKEKTPEDKSTDDDKDPTKELKEPGKHEKEVVDERGDKARSQRNRERSGYPVYQARGSWGNPGPGSGRGRGGRGGGTRNGSGGAGGTEGASHYDKPIKRPDSDRNRDEKENVRDSADVQPREPKKEKKNKEMTSGSSQDSGSKKDLTFTQEEKPATTAAKKSNPAKEQDPNKKTAKSPSGSRRNGNARGGSRLQGYGPPDDRNPFSSNNPKQDEDQPQPKEKASEGHGPKTPHPVTSGPVPLMALGEISPPEMPPRGRHHGGNYSHNHRQHEGRAVPPRMRGGGSGDPSYSTRGGNNNKGRGGGSGNGNNDAAKPLMSLNSNDLDRNSGSGERVNESETEIEGKKPTAPIGTQKKENPGNKPYDARAARDMPPRFMSNQPQHRESPPNQPSAVGSGKPTTENSSSNSFKEPAPMPHGNAWEKPITASLRSENQMPSAKNLENKDELKLASHLADLSVNSNLIHPVVAPIGQGSGNCAPVQTMIFENTNFKSGVGVNSKVVAPSKLSQEAQVKKEITGPSQSQGLEMSKEFPLTFGEDTPQLDFGSSFSDPPTSNSAISSHSQGYSKPSALLQSSRSYGSHQSSPISPLAADLNEKIQAVKSMWDIPTMPSVAESGNLGSEDDVLPGGFGGDAFKRPEPQSRDYGQSLQQNQGGFAPGAPPVMSAIAKPDSRSSPNSANVRQIKLPQSQMESQIHAAVSSSPFTYGLAQPHQGANTFGIRAVPSPPSLMYGSSHSTTNPNAMYQAFPPHVDSSQVVGSNPRTQFPQYNTPVGNAGGAPYMGESLFLPMFNTPFYQQQQHQQQTHGIPPVQVQSQNSRISPGPMPMTSSSAGVVGGAVMMNSNANSIMSMKSGQPGGMPHQNIGHQVHPGSHQQGYSQFGHPHMGHPQHHLGPVGHQKQGYSQNSMPPPNQHLQFLPFDPNQQPVLTLGGQNYLAQGMRSGHGGPPPSATPPVQGLQSSSPFYGSAGTQSGMYGGSSQGGTLQPLHVAVAQGSQQMPGLRLVNQNQPQKKKWLPKSHYP